MKTDMDAKPSSPGEELYLVHLHRYTNDLAAQDHDFEKQETQRPRSKSAGEELFNVFLKRSEGVELERDELPSETVKPASKKGAAKTHPKPISAHVISLRNREVPPPPSMAH